jgi:5-formyltetrahydrofolate cyclo-ligase
LPRNRQSPPVTTPPVPFPAASTPAEKAVWRNTLIARRAALSVADAAEASLQAARRFVRALELSSTSVVALFWSLEGEIDTRPLLRALQALGVPTALTRMQGRDRPLRFHRWQPGDPLDPGPFQVQQPLAEAAQVRPDIVLAPLLAFDLQGYRLGWGGGFYDRTIAELRTGAHPPACVGYGFACQEVEHVPREAFDQRLDMVVTEHRIVHTR